MGLDITAYKNLKVVENPKFDEYGDLENSNEWTPGASMEWSEKHFKGRGEGIQHNLVYTWEDKLNFIAGSYSEYNWWRLKLEQFADGKNFEELINFADNEGVIGYIVSKKLYKDFTSNYKKAIEYAETISDGEYWLAQYEKWKKAFEFASNNGAVDFH